MTLEIPSLGRPFVLGMLYDAREEKIIPGITLWPTKYLTSIMSRPTQKNTDLEVLTSDSFSDKSSALGISGTLKMSVLSGMVNVEGSGKYLTDTKESKTQARVTLKYKSSTKFEQLSLNQLSHQNMTYPEWLKKDTATHVVTGISYGTRAFFIFGQKVTNSEEVENVQGKLEGMVTKIVELKGKVEIDDTEREEVRQVRCTIHGDFALEKNLTTYEKAVEIYANLLDVRNYQVEVPIKVWLFPLEDLDSSIASLVREITDGLVFTAEDIMQKMSEVIMECNDMMGHPAAGSFPALANKIIQFKKLFERFRIIFQKQLSRVLSSVRSGEIEEFSLEKILTSKEKSPFSDQKIRTFLDRRWREMDYVHSLLNKVKKYSIVTGQRELRKEILDPDYESTRCFNFPLGNKDSYLSHLESWLYKEPWDFKTIFVDGETKEWFEHKGVSQRAKELVSNFFPGTREATGVKYLVTCVECSAGPGITIHEYSNGDPVTDYCTCDI